MVFLQGMTAEGVGDYHAFAALDDGSFGTPMGRFEHGGSLEPGSGPTGNRDRNHLDHPVSGLRKENQSHDREMEQTGASGRDTEAEKVSEGVERRVLAFCDELMCVENTFEKGGIG